MSIFSDIGHALSSAFHSVKHVVEKVGQGIGHVVQKALPVVADIATVVNPAIGAALQAANAVVQGVGGTVKSAIGGITGGPTGTIASVLNTIKSPLDAVTSIINGLNQNYILPIVRPIETIVNEYQSLTKSIHGDLKNGIQGILQIPTDISNALTSVDASFGRAISELGSNNENIARTVLDPAIKGAGQVPLSLMYERFTGAHTHEQAQAALHDFVTAAHELAEHAPYTGTPPSEQSVKLTDYNPGTKVQDAINQLHELAYGKAPTTETVQQFAEDLKLHPLTTRTGWIESIMQFIMGILYGGDYIAARVSASVKPTAQQANRDAPYDLLGVSDAINAHRRGFIDQADLDHEIRSQGIDPGRQEVLYRLTNFLFGPRDAVDLYARGIIARDVFDRLMSDNNLNPDQVGELEELMSRILSPPEAITLNYRGELSDADTVKMLEANRVPQDVRNLLITLAQSPVAPRPYLATEGIRAATSTNFLSGTLNNPPPQDVLDYYHKAQRPDTDAVVDWLLHWDIPPPRWWTSAVFRGRRTKEEAFEAFRALNIPEELWNDQFSIDEELPPVWLVPDVLASGVWPKDHAVETFKKLGFSDYNANILADYGLSKSKTSKATTADSLQKLSLSNAATLFEDGAIDMPTYIQVLSDHGYSQEAAQLTAELTLIKLQQQERKDYADNLAAEVQLGITTFDSALSSLYEHGYTEAEVAKYSVAMQRARRKAEQLPPRAELDKMLKKGVIDLPTWEQAYRELGYSDTWIQRIAKIL